ncbi:MAG: thiamine phosphate synthase [Planctomycetota bacterium]
MSSIGATRIIDASLNRAGEGLRVVEDYARFVLDDRHLTEVAKTLRHELASAGATISSSDRHAARETQSDVGATITAAGEIARLDAWHVCAASLKRVEQSLRSIEEYGKLIAPEFAAAVESLRYRAYTLEKALDTTRTSRERLGATRLCVLIEGQKSKADLASLAEKLIAAGAGMLQLRDKRLEDRCLLWRARALVSVTRGAGVLAIVNDRPDIAVAANADGVHLGQTDLSVHDARSILGAGPLIGVSTHSIDQARQAVLQGANYLGAGPTFPSKTKAFDAFPGLDYLRAVSHEVSLPSFAIGGIDAKNLPAVMAAGAGRVAVGSAVTTASDPAAATKQLVGLLPTDG